MRSRLAHSALWSITGSGTQYSVVFLLLVYLAHVLQPHDFGLMATVSVGLDLGTRIARWGQVELLQQKKYRTDEARNQSLRLSLAIAAGFVLLFVAAAEPLGRLYHSRQLALMMYMCAPVFLFSATSSTAEAILRTEFRFRVLAFRNTVTTLIGAAVAILLANGGYGALALSAQRLIQAVIAGLWVWTALDWRPKLFGRIPLSPVLAREGAHVMAGTVLPLLVPRSVDLFVGFALGPAQLGLMRVAVRVNDFVGQLVVMPLVSVANAQLSAMSGDREAMRRSYLRLTQASAALMCPMLIGMALTAHEAVPVIFGEKWSDCVPMVQIIGLLGVVAPINYYFPAAMVALGQSRLVFRQGIFQLVLGVALAAVAAQISLVAIAIALVIRGAIVGIYNVVDLRRWMDLSLTQLGKYMAPPYLGTAVMSLAVILVRAALGGEFGKFATLLILSSAGAVTYVGTLWFGGRIGLWPSHAAFFPRGFRGPAAAAA